MDDPPLLSTSTTTSPPSPPPPPPPLPTPPSTTTSVPTMEHDGMPATPIDNKIWTTQPKSFPKNDNPEGVTVADLNDFPNNDQDTTPPPSVRRSVKFADNLNDESEQRQNRGNTSPEQDNFILRDKNSRFWKTRDSIFVHKDVLRRQSDADSDHWNGDHDNEESDNEFEGVELTEGYENYGFEDYGQRNGTNGIWRSNNDNTENDDGGDDDDDDEETRLWDTPKSIPPIDDDASATSGWSEFFLKLLKLASYGVTFVLVLGFAVLSKLSFHLIASMTRVNKTVTACNDNLDGILDHDKHYHAWHGLFSPERIAWLWVLLFVMLLPEVYTFLRSIKVCLFKQYYMPSAWHTFLMIATNTSEVIGLSLFAFLVLPSIDTISGLIFTNCVCLVPSGCLVLRIWQENASKNKNDQAENGNNHEEGEVEGPKLAALHFYLLAFVLQIISLLAWPVILHFNNNEAPSRFGYENPRDEMALLSWSLPLSGILISFGYWENFVPDDGTGFMKTLSEIKKLPIVSKYAIYSIISVWKMALYFGMFLLSQSVIAFHYEGTLSAISNMIDKLFTEFGTAFSTHPIGLLRENSLLNDVNYMDSDPWTPVIVGLINVAAGMLCHRTVIFVCKIRIQPFSFGLPIHLVLPFSISIMNLFVNFYFTDVCVFSEQSSSFEYMFWNVHYDLFTLSGFWNKLILLIWLASFVSKAITVSHVWIASKERLGSSDQLFVLPFYSSAIIEQSIMLSRRVDEDLFSSVINRERNDDDSDEGGIETSSMMSDIDDSKSSRIRVYACATVWHETADELLMMLKSIMRMDQDQACRKLAVKMFDSPKSTVDYYDFQTHLFVDDAFLFGKSFKEDDRLVNSYVKTMINVLDEAASNIHQTNVKLRPPRIYITPYGGRLEWRLPGGTKLIAHLKDKLKIRHRKRWSQVMYMYYLLGFKIFQKGYDEVKREELLRNTFILALDGDINFRPEAVLLLIDLMRKNKNLGAACGRIHPVGSGPMAWYQVFEYAISHWLQKATEHVFGCVLCSPGCFSLFRSSALCDTNVMHKYTTKPEEAIHYVQYDQGEDRWLCTLMLQQGWRVEYSAAADAFTHCPEGFAEFFIQRRRWGPSTMANIYDLLMNSKQTVKKNDNISSLYILYQTAMMFGTILSPGTIFLMLVGAMNTAFNLPTEYSFYINFAPVLLFVIVCFTCKTDFQLLIAQILSTFYAMLMLAVLVSTAIEIKEKTIYSPSVLFFVGMISVFVIAAFIHPQEFYCLFPLPVYMMTIPAMYLLLTIYSIINMNIVTWGTRENPQQQQPEAAAAAAVEKSKAAEKHGFLHDIGAFFNNKNSWGLNCACCSGTKDDEELYYLRDIKNSVGKVNDDVVYLKAQMDTQVKYTRADLRRRSSIRVDATTRLLDDVDDSYLSDENDALNALDGVLQQNKAEAKPKNVVKFDDGPNWVQDIKDIYKDTTVVAIKNSEKKFWIRFIEQYLKPLDEDKAHQDKVKADLIDLRNKVVFAFGIINIIFVLFVFLLQINKDTFGFQLHIKGGINGTEHDEDTGDERPTYEITDVDLDPIGTVLILFFGAILLLQFIGMFLHRFETITHLLAFTDISFFKIREEDANDMKTIQEHAVDIVRVQLNKPPPEGKYEYLDILEYFVDSYVQRGNRGFNPQKITKKINIQRRSSVAHLLKEKQESVIAKSNMMFNRNRRLSHAIRAEIVREQDFDSDNESVQLTNNSGYGDDDSVRSGSWSNNSFSSRSNGSTNSRGGSVRSVSSNGSRHSRRSQNSVERQNDIHNVSTMFADNIIQSALNIVNGNDADNEQRASVADPVSPSILNEHHDHHNQVQPDDKTGDDLSQRTDEIELRNLSPASESSSAAIIDVPQPEMITPRWTAANDFTSNIEESTRL